MEEGRPLAGFFPSLPGDFTVAIKRKMRGIHRCFGQELPVKEDRSKQTLAQRWTRTEPGLGTF